MIEYVSFGETESGDRLVIVGWDFKPSKEDMDKAYQELYPYEYEAVGGVNCCVAKIVNYEDLKAFE